RKKKIRCGHHHPLVPTPSKSGGAADHRCKQAGEQRGGGGEQERHAGAVKHAGKAVAAEIICSEPMLARWSCAGNVTKLVGVSGRRDDTGKHTGERHEGKECDCEGACPFHDSLLRGANKSAEEFAIKVTTVTIIVRLVKR